MRITPFLSCYLVLEISGGGRYFLSSNIHNDPENGLWWSCLSPCPPCTNFCVQVEPTYVLQSPHGRVSGTTLYSAKTVGEGQIQLGKCTWQSKKLQMTTTVVQAVNMLENSLALKHRILKAAHLCKSAVYGFPCLVVLCSNQVWWPCHLLGRGKLSRWRRERKRRQD